LPAALLALLVFWCGTFQGAASAAGALAHQAAVLLFCLLTPGLRDPLDLGDSGRLLPVAILALIAVSWWFSPVGRAGLVGLTLLPAYLLLPASTARCWREPLSHRVGLTSLSLVVLLANLTALIRWQTLSLPRASLPLGHHNLLAGWLVLVLPLALTAGRFPGVSRWLAIGAGATGLVTMAATGSLLGAAAVTAQAIVGALWWKRFRPWLVPGLLTLVVLALPRLLSIAQSIDPSARARASYLEAAWRGLLARPTLGWGPGAVPWTLGEFMRPVTGVHPASQVVGDLHSLPLQVAYEIGVVGMLLVLAIALVFFIRRRREIGRTTVAIPRRAALLGLLGGAVFALGSAPLSVPALPATAAVVAGVALQGQTAAPSRRRMPFLVAYLLLAATLLVPLDRGHFLYDEARRASSPEEGLLLIDRAQELDPDFPLYLARKAWLASEILGVSGELADQALEAAGMAPGLAPLWLAAGDLGRRADRSWAPTALSQAHRLDPLSPLTAFHLMMALGGSDEAVHLGQVAVSEEPRLAAARWWWNHPEMADRISRQIVVPIPRGAESSAAEPMVLALTLDHTPALSFSLFAFRRSPWPGRVAPVAMGGDGSETSKVVAPQRGARDTISSLAPDLSAEPRSGLDSRTDW